MQNIQLRAKEVVTRSHHPAFDVAQLTIKDNAKERIIMPRCVSEGKQEIQAPRNSMMYNTSIPMKIPTRMLYLSEKLMH